ncbi:hypothetical protein DEJ50_01165 [Streptomyces venezuelae]|uniref:Uncharacterized protein n=1 Tax=Streptomyces venezuelae TaxID=54571 RepID=A0A5P2CUX9_STRVZ|nr:hypothetical protein DEJ50_01165 [Streptomyces venezuelae]
MASARVAVNFTSWVLHGKTSWSDGFADLVGAAGFAGVADLVGVAGLVGVADLAGVAGLVGVADLAGAADPVGVAAGAPGPPGASSSVGPQAVRVRADTAARATAALRTVLMGCSPRSRTGWVPASRGSFTAW